MKKIVLILLALSARGYAGTPQVVFGGGVTTAANSHVYGILESAAGGNGNTNAAENIRQQPWAVAGTWSNLQFNCDAAPTGTQTNELIFRVNGTSSTIDTTMTGTATRSSDTTHTVTTAATDLVNYELATSATAATAHCGFSIQFNPTIANQYVIASQTSPNASTIFQAFSSGQTQATEANATGILSPPGTISNLSCISSVAPGSGKTNTFTVRLSIGGVMTDSNVVATCSNTTSCNDLSDSTTTVAGQLISLKTVETAGGTSSTAGCTAKFTPTNAGEFPLIAATPGTNAATTYEHMSYTSTLMNASETVVTVPSNSTGYTGLTLKNLYVNSSVGPAGVKSWKIQFRANSASPASSPNCTISNPNTTCNDTTNTYVSQSTDTLNYQEVPTGSPAASVISVGMTGIFPQPAAAAGNLRGLLIQGGHFKVSGGHVKIQ